MAPPAAGFWSGSATAAAAAVPFCSAFGGSIEPMVLAKRAPTRSGLDEEENGINNLECCFSPRTFRVTC